MPLPPLPAFPRPRPGPRPVVPDLRLRPCRDGDLSFLRRLYRDVREEELSLANWPEAMKEVFCEQQFAAQHTDYVRRFPRAQFLLIQAGGRAVGRLIVDEPQHDLRVVDLSLIADLRGQGHGTAILRALQALADSSQRTLRLSVLRENSRALALYERLGFRHEPGNGDETRHQLSWTGQN